MAKNDALMPHNVEFEEGLLGSILIDPDVIIKVSVFLAPEDFYIERNAWIFEAALALEDRNAPIDVVTLSDELNRRGRLSDVGGSAYLVGLMNATVSSLHAGYYAQVISELSTRRKLIDAAGKMARLAYDLETPLKEVFSQSEEAVFKATPIDHNRIKTLHELAQEEVERQEEIAESGEAPGIDTGIADLDKMMGGMQGSDFIIVSGHQGMGKTAFVINTITMNAAEKQKKRIGVISLEMSGNQLVQRVIASKSGVPLSFIRKGLKSDNHWTKFFDAIKELDLPIYVDDTPAMTAQEFRAKAKRMAIEYGLDMLVVDYLQLMEAGIRTDSDNAKVAYISRTTKWVARELNIPVVAISNLRKEASSGKDKHPQLADLFGSTALQFDASHVIFVHRDEVFIPETEFPNVAELILAKNRQGPGGVAGSFFRKESTTFLDLEIRSQPLGY